MSTLKDCLLNFCEKALVYYKSNKRACIESVVMAVSLVILAVMVHNIKHGYVSTLYQVKIAGDNIGIVSDESELNNYITKAYSKIYKETGELSFSKPDYTLEGTTVNIFTNRNENRIEESIYNYICNNSNQEEVKAYDVRIGDFTVTLSTLDDVVDMLNKAKAKYDPNNEFTVELEYNSSHEVDVITAAVVKSNKSANMVNVVSVSGAGVGTGYYPEDQIKDGAAGLGFEEEIEIAQTIAEPSELSSVDEAVESIVKEKEQNTIYEVQEGDCLSIIAQRFGMPIDRIVALNGFEDENSTIQVGDELIVTVPEPELSVVLNDVQTYEEEYSADVEYVNNDSWYTTQEEVITDAVPGKRIATAAVTFKNGIEISRTIISEKIVNEAVAKVVERGTQTPPTYIKPLSGGRFSSGFGPRWGGFHKGVDWSCGVGTAIKASCGGIISRAGWSSSYGYVIYIDHPDGKQTRYAHLNGVLVAAGDKVEQGEKIALSGNTGDSTGPHLHFEILIGGKQVNPLDYLN